jgi:hypothetical protein
MKRCRWCRSIEHASRECTRASIVVRPNQQAYIDRILADSAAVYAQEVREFNASRRAA